MMLSLYIYTDIYSTYQCPPPPIHVLYIFHLRPLVALFLSLSLSLSTLRSISPISIIARFYPYLLAPSLRLLSLSLLYIVPAFSLTLTPCEE